MKIPQNLLDEFAKVTRDQTPKKKEYTIYGTVQSVNQNGGVTVKFDGAEINTPCSGSVEVAYGDRVIVSVKNRQATVTSNVAVASDE